jgi:hypothetical protein
MLRLLEKILHTSLRRSWTLGVYCSGRGANEGGLGLADVAYISRVKIEPVEGKIRRAQIPGEEEPVLFGAIER